MNLTFPKDPQFNQAKGYLPLIGLLVVLILLSHCFAYVCRNFGRTELESVAANPENSVEPIGIFDDWEKASRFLYKHGLRRLRLGNIQHTIKTLIKGPWSNAEKQSIAQTYFDKTLWIQNTRKEIVSQLGQYNINVLLDSTADPVDAEIVGSLYSVLSCQKFFIFNRCSICSCLYLEIRNAPDNRHIAIIEINESDEY
ncbi:MAG: hypothetical protein AB1656_13530 [Candidatus Omnitrophota bacterium]